MTFNSVTVSAQWTDGTTPGEGNYLFSAQGNFMDSSALAVVTPVRLGQLDSTGHLSVFLLASDNFQEGDLNWHILVRVKGAITIDVADVPVNFSLGATQSLFDILTAAGWTANSD